MADTPLTAPDPAALREIIDRQQIWECLLRYARGMDRLDLDLALSAYHPGAIEDHGAVIAACEEFVPRVLEFHRTGEIVTQHILTNHSCEIDGDTAHTETYTHCFSVYPQGPHRIAFGRFVDRLERRNGRWAIATRVSIPEGATDVPRVNDRAGMVDLPGALGHGARDRSDPSYLRPLPLTRG